MDDFEKHIMENRDQFNVHKPNKAKMWAVIADELDNDIAVTPKVIPLWKAPFFKVAASIVLTVGILSIISLSLLTHAESTNMANSELQEIDIHYQAMVNYQVQLVKNNENLSPKDKDEFLQFMDELDEEYNELTKDLKDNLDNEIVLEAIIQNYKKRIELIENLLKQINESKKTPSDDEYLL